MKERIILILFFLLIVCTKNMYCTESLTKDMASELELEQVIQELEKYVQEADLDEISSDLIGGKGINYETIGKGLLGNIKSVLNLNFKKIILVIIFLVVIAIIKSLELEKDSTVAKASNIVAILVVSSFFLNIYSDVMNLMKHAVEMETGIVQVISPFLMGILVLSGAITTSGIIEPVMLLLVSCMGICVNYVIIPLITISLIFNIITNLSDTIKLDRLTKLASKTSIWIIGIFITLFLALIGIQTSISTSLDSITLKTTQAAFSGSIPVIRQVCFR